MIEELVPAEHSISGRTYWTEIRDGRFSGRDLAVGTLRDLRRCDPERKVRLVKVTREVEES